MSPVVVTGTCFRAAQDVTVLVLLGAGVLSLVLNLAVEGGDSWIEGAAIMAAVAVVVLVTAVNNYQKEAQFRELNKLNEDTQVGSQDETPANGHCARREQLSTLGVLHIRREVQIICKAQSDGLCTRFHSACDYGVPVKMSPQIGAP